MKRGSITQERIIDAAYGVARTQDLRSITVQKVADQIGCSPMAIYRHFGSISEVVAKVVSRFVAEADVTGHGVDPNTEPRNWVLQTFKEMYLALVHVPGILPTLGSIDHFGEGMLDVLDDCLGVLTDLGLDEERSVSAFLSMAAFTLGLAGITNASSRQLNIDDENSLSESVRLSSLAFAANPGDVYANVVRAAPSLGKALISPDFEHQFSLILDGVMPE